MDRTPDIIFEDLLLSLEKEGFAPSPDDYIEFAALFSHFEGKREDLKYYLAPVICRNKEDQEKFYEVYDNFYSETDREKAFVVKPSSIRHPSSTPKFFFRTIRSFYFWLIFGFFLAGSIRIIPLLRRHHPAKIATESPAPVDAAPSTQDAEPRHSQRVFVAKRMSPVTDTGTLKSVIAPIGPTIEKENTVHPTAFAWLVMLGLACLGLSTSFFPQKRSRFLPEVDLDTKSGDDTPMELPFFPKDHLIQKLPALASVSRHLLRPVGTGIYRLDIKKTITRSIYNYGYLSPIYNSVERKPEYLVLIEKEHTLHYHLFRYLTRVFTGDKVNINYYHYNDEGTFYPESAGVPVDFYGLRERHSHAKLIIMGTGHRFIGNANDHWFAECRHWEQRVIVTATPVSDWGQHEKILAERFRLLSADIESLLHLVEYLSSDEDSVLPAFQRPDIQAGAYPENSEAVQEYLGDEDLFQWVCALAVYPSLQWEVVLAVGQAVLQERNALQKFTFTSLLKIVRIRWLKGQAIPHSIRVELLKKLHLREEIVTRQTILSLLKESDELLIDKSFSYEERMMQIYTQSFVLYASNIRKNKQYGEDAKKFMSLWDRKKVPDLSTVLYLKNQRKEWDTPVRSIGDDTQSIGADRFINELLARQVISDPRVRSWFRRAGALCFFALFLLFLFKDSIQGMGVNKALGIVQRDYHSSGITIVIPVDDCIRKMTGAHPLTVTLKNYDNNLYAKTLSVGNKDSLSIRFDDITMAGKDPEKQTFQLLLGNNDLTIDCTSKEFYERYRLLIQGADCTVPLRPVLRRQELQPNAELQ